MIHRLGMYYLAAKLQHEQDAARVRRRGRREPVPHPEELGMLLGAGAALAAMVGAVALVLWTAS